MARSTSTILAISRYGGQLSQTSPGFWKDLTFNRAMGLRYPWLRRKNRKTSPKIGGSQSPAENPLRLLLLADAGDDLASSERASGGGLQRRSRRPLGVAQTLQQVVQRLQRSHRRLPAELLASPRRVHHRHPQGEVYPAWGGRLHPQLPGEIGGGAQGSGRQRKAAGAEELTELLDPDLRLGSDVESALDLAHDRLPVGLADVARVDRLEAEARHPRHQRNQALADQEARQEGAGEEAADLARSLGFEDQAGAQADHPHVGLAQLEGVEQGFHRRLVPRVEGAGDPVHRPGLVHLPFLWPGAVGADRGGVDQGPDP